MAVVSYSPSSRDTQSRLEETAIGRFIQNRLIQKDPFEDSKKCGRVTLKVLAIVGAVSGAIPFIQTSYTSGTTIGGGPGMGVMLAYGNSVAFGIVDVWALWDVIGRFLGAKSPEEIDLESFKKSHLCKKISRAVFSIILGTIAHAPIAYLSYKLNVGGWFSPGMMFGASMLTGPGLAINSTDLTLEALAKKKPVGFECVLTQMKEKIFGLISANRDLLKGSKIDEITEYLQQMRPNQRSIQWSEDRSVDEYVEGALKPRSVEEEPLPTWKSKAWNVGTTVVGGVILTTQMLALGYITALGVHLCVNHLPTEIVGAALAVGANLFLQTGAIVGAAKKVFNTCKDALWCRFSLSLSERLYPKTCLAIELLSAVTTAFAFGPSVQVSEDFIAPINEGLGVYSSVVVSLGSCFLAATAVFFITDELMKAGIHKFGSEHAKAIVELDYELEKLSGVLQESPHEAFAEFVEALPAGVFDQLQEAVTFTREDLSLFINQSKELRAAHQEKVALLPKTQRFAAIRNP